MRSREVFATWNTSPFYDGPGIRQYDFLQRRGSGGVNFPPRTFGYSHTTIDLMESCLLRKAVGEDELQETFYALVNRTPGLKPQGFRESAVPEPEAPGE